MISVIKLCYEIINASSYGLHLVKKNFGRRREGNLQRRNDNNVKIIILLLIITIST